VIVEKERGRKSERKPRSDKKRDVKPTVHISLYECVSRLSYITNSPMKDVAEYLCMRGLNSRKTIEVLASKFRRDYKFQNTHFIGDLEIVPERVLKKTGVRKRLPIRFSQGVHDKIGDLAYSLDLTISSATALLLETSVKNTEFLDTYIAEHVTATLDSSRQEQLKEVLRFIKRDNPFSEEITLSRLIGYIVEEVMDHTVNAKKVVENWLDSVVQKK
jgi:hypothetical protein